MGTRVGRETEDLKTSDARPEGVGRAFEKSGRGGMGGSEERWGASVVRLSPGVVDLGLLRYAQSP
ncbi:MAG: hypothetical protein JWO82_4101 [Akkermansiaceae bacterium]|nr:hypothetical protein [Akkermansiaceae bacterium]